MTWAELGALSPYDYVMCRGNSLAYADCFQRETATTLAAVESHLADIARAVAPGGYLHIDAPREAGVARTEYPAGEFRGAAVTVTEHVDVVGGYRRWAQQVTIDGAAHAFTFDSAPLTGSLLRQMLLRAGFANADEVCLNGERDSYQVLLARKPTRPIGTD